MLTSVSQTMETTFLNYKENRRSDEEIFELMQDEFSNYVSVKIVRALQKLRLNG